MYEDFYEKYEKTIYEFDACMQRLKSEASKQQDLREIKNIVVDMKNKMTLLIEMEECDEIARNILRLLLREINLMNVRLNKDLKI